MTADPPAVLFSGLNKTVCDSEGIGVIIETKLPNEAIEIALAISAEPRIYQAFLVKANHFSLNLGILSKCLSKCFARD